MKTTFKTILAASAIAAPMFMSNLQAQTGVTWNPGATSPAFWTDINNWGGVAVPITGYKAFFNAASATPCIVDATVGGCQLAVGDGGGPDTIIVTNGGSLSAGDTTLPGGSLDNNAWTGLGNTAQGTIQVENGGAVKFNYHLWIGNLNPTGNGTLIMNGGVASVTNDGNANWQCGNLNGGYGHIQMNGGTLFLGKWDAGRFSTNNASSMDIAGGTVIVTGGDRTANINADIAAGKVTAFGGPGTGLLTVDYNTINPGYTTLFATGGGGGGGGGCVTVQSFNNTAVLGLNGGWSTATQTDTSTNVQISGTGSAGFGDGYMPISPSVSTTANLKLTLDVTLTASDVMAPVVVLDDGNGHQLQYVFLNTPAGHQVLTTNLSAGVPVGAGSFNYSTISFIHVQLNPEGVTGAYTVAFNDLSITGCGGGSGASHIDSVSASASQVNISASTAPGSTYHVNGSFTLPAAWNPVAGTTTNASSSETLFTFPKPGNAMEFFRVSSP